MAPEGFVPISEMVLLAAAAYDAVDAAGVNTSVVDAAAVA